MPIISILWFSPLWKERMYFASLLECPFVFQNRKPLELILLILLVYWWITSTPFFGHYRRCTLFKVIWLVLIITLSCISYIFPLSIHLNLVQFFLPVLLLDRWSRPICFHIFPPACWLRFSIWNILIGMSIEIDTVNIFTWTMACVPLSLCTKRQGPAFL